jgi:hypothetical protein
MRSHSHVPGQAAGAGGLPRRSEVVPYIAAWKGERKSAVLPVLDTFGRGITFPDEAPEDRDERGVLWSRSEGEPGLGQPQYNRVHARRQRQVMGGLLCQVCARPASRTEEGWLWLLHDDRAGEPGGWPEQVGATHPPLCLPCARLSVRLCPHLREGAVAVRVAEPRPWGVYGALYEPARGGGGRATARVRAMVGYHDPLVAWVLAAQMVRLLRGCTVVDLDDRGEA